MHIDMRNRWNIVARRTCAVAIAGTMALSMAGCAAGAGSSSNASAASGNASTSANASNSEEPQQQGQQTASKAYAAEIDESPYKLEITSRDGDSSYDESKAASIMLNGSSAEASGEGVSADGSTITITAEGVYVMSGTLDDGQVVVNAPDSAKVQLVLKGASITNNSDPAIYVKQADKCFITLADGTENKLADGQRHSTQDVDAALYSDCDLTLQGTGQLSVSGNSNDAIKTKDDLVITGGAYALKATSDALNGHDSVKISGGSFAIDAGNDGIKSSKDDDDSKGFVSISGGTFMVNAADKGINAAKYIRVSDSAKLDITSGGDAIHSDTFARIAGGEVSISSGDDAVHAEYVLAVDDGTVNVTKCKEGYEAQVITVNGSTTNIVSADDGINASTGGTSSSGNDEPQGFGGFKRDRGQDQGSQGAQPGEGMQPGAGSRPNEGTQPIEGAQPPEPPTGNEPPAELPSGSTGTERVDPGAQDGVQGGSTGGNRMGPRGGHENMNEGGGQGAQGDKRGMGGMMGDSDENCVLTINGGTITIEAEGDGVDSNGYLHMNGGSVYVSGPTSSGNGSLDYGLGAEVTGGTFIAAGSAGMAETFTGGTQPFARVNVTGAAGDAITVSDADGNALIQYTPTKDFQCVTLSAPGMVEGGEYKLIVNGSETSFTASTTAASSGPGRMNGGGRRDM